jgi:predicted AAA+ superfamily ATPase
MELRAYQGYEAPDLDLTYWRTSSGQEIDFIFGDKQLAIEIKGSPRVHEGDLKNFKALLEDGPVKKCIVVCLEKQPRILENKIEVLPWKIFLKRLWNHELISA